MRAQSSCNTIIIHAEAAAERTAAPASVEKPRREEGTLLLQCQGVGKTRRDIKEEESTREI